MRRATFDLIVDQLRPRLTKQDTVMRQAIPVGKRVAITIWRLARNSDLVATSKQFCVGKSTVLNIFRETCEAIVDILMPQYIRRPSGARLQTIIDGFRQKYGMVQCAGAIDGTHIPIIAPEKDHADYHNRKQFHSIILQGVCDHQYRFIDINVGWPGRVHDARVFRHSSIVDAGQNGLLFPETTENISGVDIPIMIIGDPAYPLLRWLMKGYRDNGRLTPEQKLFNFTLSRNRMVIEGTYGRLKGRWRCLLTRHDSSTEFVPTVITACCILHNICEIHKNKIKRSWLKEIEDELRAQRMQQQEVNGENVPGVDVASAEAIRAALTRHFALTFPDQLAIYQ
ncbi:uncharacterized protein [Amphiura filiformis]|uniref:uncharacterized protein n=1 Tax=Amphiura filiformis TaxID=82378 RepID=UPI003B21980F